MSWIDVAIPGLIGLWLFVRPQAFFRASGQQEKDAASTQKFRMIGLLLLGAAGLYFLVKRMSTS